MKKVKVLLIAVFLIITSIFTLTSSAMAVSGGGVVFTPTDDNIFLIEYKADLADMGVTEFGMYEYNNTNNAIAIIGSKDIQAIKERKGVANYSLAYIADSRGSGGAFTSNGINLHSISGQFQFYYIQNGATVWSATGTPFGDTTPSNEYDFLDGNIELHDMTASAVPIPASIFLFGTGLVGLVGLKRRKTA